ncbi:D-aspartate oxidase [Hippoglossus hippoglossus]|uniref:D-aspartate oxidase n=1 Tax=Hippoglossus hippoglossus TaxID=8267 RepID=UPI00148D16DD|nr:D-aspartate oxidase [Hippoglossus hippoglossus]XP_034431305.1 D-aspartate oxidase [Hippoglossus hippoglossus]XP_034431306.1 D-aspartate oxidase [Hippoglossus hippoglossus]
MTSVKVVVVGAGVIGFSTAVCIAEALPSCSVTLLSEKFSPDTTSDGAAGILFAGKFPDIPLERQRLWFKDSFDHLLAIAQSQHSPEAGVMLSSGWQIFKEVPADKVPFWSEFVIGFRLMTGRELRRFPDHTFGQAFTTIKCECSSYLPWLENRFKRAGGQVQQRKVDNLQELSNSYDIIVNCSGLGSKLLVGDTQVYPVRGQVLKVEAPWLQHFIRDGDGKTYIYPGIHSVTVGGTRQEGDWRLEVDEGDTKSILERCGRLEPSISKAKVLSEWVGLRPSRRNPRVERELVQLQGRQVPVVHNYGHGGWGVTLAWGTALDAMRLVRQCLSEKPARAKL